MSAYSLAGDSLILRAETVLWESEVIMRDLRQAVSLLHASMAQGRQRRRDAAVTVQDAGRLGRKAETACLPGTP